MSRIEIKSHFTDWHKVDEKQAKKYVEFLMRGIVMIPQNRRAEYIETHHLRGVTVHELLS